MKALFKSDAGFLGHILMLSRRAVTPLLGVFVLLVSATLGVVSKPASAATVSVGTCTAEVDNATGVTMTVTPGGDCVLTFTRAGTTTWTVPSGVTSLRTLILGGGGGGGFDIGGGGGAGGFREVESVLTTPGETATIQVGTGGNGDTSRGVPCVGDNGTPSSLVILSASLSAIGGGGCGGQDGGGACATDGIAGASGGGGGVGIQWPRVGGVGSYATDNDATTFGNSGGVASPSSYYAGGGGGGAGGVGGAGSANGSGAIGGNGGSGKDSNITGAIVTYAGGGAGGFFQSGTRGIGGTGGGGSGGTGGVAPGIGTDGRGGGGGGGGGQNRLYGQGSRGGSGVVIVRYSFPAAPVNSVLPVVSGTTRTGSTLTATSGSWTSSPTFAYQWQRAATSSGTYSNIGSATNSTYVLTDSDIGKYIKVSVVATNGVGSVSALSDATSVVTDLPDSVVPTVTNPVATTNGFTFSISNHSTSYAYVLTTTKGTVSRTTDDVTVTGLVAGESATVTISVTQSLYKPASKVVTGSAIPAATTTTTAAPALSIVIQAPATTVAQGQASVATVAPTTTTLPVLAANGLPVPTTTTSTTIAPARARTVVTTTLPRVVTTTTLGPPVVDKVDAGQSAVQVDGVKTDAVVTRSNNQMVVTSGSLSATLSGLDKTGKRAALDSNGVVHLAVGDVIKISLGGFKPESIVEVWLFSTPTKLGTAEVGADGKMSGSYKLPFGTKSGAHRVVVTAKLPNGKPTTFTLGILVGDISTTSTLTRVLIAIPISLAIGFGFLLPTRIRRRRKALPA